jgi:hypothetical protein
MNRSSWVFINFVCFFLLVILFISLQTSLFHKILGQRANIQAVLVVITYVCLSRSPGEALLFSALASFASGLISVMPDSLNVFSGMLVCVCLRGLKKLSYSPSPVYFNWTALGTVLGFHIFSWLTALIFETNPPPFTLINWILEILLTALFTRVIYVFCIWLDHKTKRLTLSELES